MPVRMVATRRRVYDPSTRHEYSQGETFDIHDPRVARRLERSRQAELVPSEGKEEKFPAHPPPLRTRALTPSEPPAPAPDVPPASVTLSPAEDTSPFAETPTAPDAEAPSTRRYARRDLRAEES